MPPEQVINTVIGLLAIGLLAIGLLSMLIGWLVASYDRLRPRIEAWRAARSVKHFPADMPPRTRADVRAAMVRPGSEAGRTSLEPVEIPDTSQLEPAAPAVYEPSFDPPVASHKMGRKELTVLLAVQKDGEGAYRFSANKIAEFVGGTSAEVKGWVADVRGRREPAASTMTRPAGGWGKAP